MKTFRKKLLEKASSEKHLERAPSKAQSALEYLMTYGWAIIIIAVVLVALVNLGVFTPSPPTAIPGSCQVVRTTQGTELLGVCGALPNYVAQFNGYNTRSNMTLSNFNFPGLPFTITFWTKLYGYGGGWFVDIGPFKSYTGYGGGFYTGKAYFWNYSGNEYSIPFPNLNTEQWYFITLRLNSSGGVSAWLNGTFVGANQLAGPLYGRDCCYPVGIGGLYSGGGFIQGNIANVQVYDTALSANEIQALYLEGIGGAPIDLQHLVAWWPLNGNANDYSGNNQNLVPTNVMYTSNWQSGYSTP